MKLTAHYYRQHDADLAAEVRAEAFHGWTTREMEFPREECALLRALAGTVASPQPAVGEGEVTVPVVHEPRALHAAVDPTLAV